MRKLFQKSISIFLLATLISELAGLSAWAGIRAPHSVLPYQWPTVALSARLMSAHTRRIVPASRLLSNEARSLPKSSASPRGIVQLRSTFFMGWVGAALYLAFQGDSELGALLVASTLFPMYPRSEFLENIVIHREQAATRLGVSHDTLRNVVTPERLIRTSFDYRLDNGMMDVAQAWRIVAGRGGKGGLRSRPETVESDVMALHLDMDVKLPPSVTVNGIQLRGGKGGSNIDLNKRSTAEKARWMRSWVEAVEDAVWKNEGEVAFGPLFDTPAPDVGTSQPDINLMDYFADHHVRWLVEHADRVMPWLEINDPLTAKDLRILQQSHHEEPIQFDESGSQLELPYSDRILKLRQNGRLRSLRLLASVTGKSAPKRDQVFGRGGITGRSDATGMGLSFATLEIMKLRGELPADADAFFDKTIAIEGFGNVGHGAAVSFDKLEAKVVAIAEYDAATKQEFALHSPDGFRPEILQAMDNFRNQHKTLMGFESDPVGFKYGVSQITKEQFWQVAVDAMVPAAKEKTITAEVAQLLRSRFVVEGGNGATTPEADVILRQRKIEAIPDVVANAGGVFVSWMEMLQNVEEDGVPWTETVVFEKLKVMISRRLQELDAYAHGHTDSTLRDAAHEVWLQSRLPTPPKSSVFSRAWHSGALRVLRDSRFARQWWFLPTRQLLYYPRKSFYMVQPEQFSVRYEINDWMNKRIQPEAKLATAQFLALQEVLKKSGAKVLVDKGSNTAPDLVFTANAGLAYIKDGVKTLILSRFRYPERQDEESLFEAAFKNRGYKVVNDLFDQKEFWEGEGDMLENRGVLYGGWGFRSAASAHEKVAKFIGLPAVELHLVDGRFYHLDTALAFLDADTAMAYMPAFDERSQKILRQRFRAPGKRLVELDFEDAALFAANAIVFGRKIVMNTVSDKLVHQLATLNFTVIRTPMSEFIKAGGATKCSVLNLPAFRMFSWFEASPRRLADRFHRRTDMKKIIEGSSSVPREISTAA